MGKREELRLVGWLDALPFPRNGPCSKVVHEQKQRLFKKSFCGGGKSFLFAGTHNNM